jgi:hypothetical protein
VIRATIDEISEGADGVDLASLVTDDDETITVPAALLPEGADVGDVVAIDMAVDAEQTKQRKAEVAKLQKRLFGFGFGA